MLKADTRFVQALHGPVMWHVAAQRAAKERPEPEKGSIAIHSNVQVLGRELQEQLHAIVELQE